MKILILYHSNVFNKKPGADEHIHTTAKSLSGKNEVTLVTWGIGTSKILEEETFKIVHFGKNMFNKNFSATGKIPSFLRVSIAYLGFYYILLLKNSGPSFSELQKKYK